MKFDVLKSSNIPMDERSMENAQMKTTSKVKPQLCPQSSQIKVIITSNESSYTFDKLSYKEEYLRDIIKKSEWDLIVKEASMVLGNSWAKKREKDQIKIEKWVIALAIIAVILLICYMATISISSENEDTYLLIIAGITSTSGLTLTFFLAVYNFNWKLGKFKSLEHYMKEDMDEYLAKLNIKYYNQLEFIYIPTTMWIECNILVKRNPSLSPSKLNEIKGNEPVGVAYNEDEITPLPQTNRSRYNGAVADLSVS